VAASGAEAAGGWCVWVCGVWWVGGRELLGRGGGGGGGEGNVAGGGAVRKEGGAS